MGSTCSPMANHPAGRTGGKKMYTAKLFNDLFAYNPVMIINDCKSKTLLEALQYAINRSADTIIRIDMYNDGVYVDTSVLKDGNFIY